MTYRVINDVVIKTADGDLELKKDQTVKLPEKIAQKLIEAKKIIPSVVDTIARPFDGTVASIRPPGVKAEDTSKEKKGFQGVYRPTQADLELQEYIGKPSMNPNGYKCFRCGAIAGRYCLGEDNQSKTWWGWMCLNCRPYSETERN